MSGLNPLNLLTILSSMIVLVLRIICWTLISENSRALFDVIRMKLISNWLVK